ncbi:hypothetical protein I79_000707 [Cricetulus griseus]|uniref:Uncharacterized protein n=1 Tax=Cricetulus griseus TaxID=10029 RepID=G3GST6_CRIGR|nr:hypothetical protein I79_000707 [Cricetulus griseus]
MNFGDPNAYPDACTSSLPTESSYQVISKGQFYKNRFCKTTIENQLLKYFQLCVYVVFMPVMCMCRYNAFRVQKRASDSLELQLCEFVSRPMWMLGAELCLLQDDNMLN